jgi:hypothetical protein
MFFLPNHDDGRAGINADNAIRCREKLVKLLLMRQGCPSA